MPSSCHVVAAAPRKVVMGWDGVPGTRTWLQRTILGRVFVGSPQSQAWARWARREDDLADFLIRHRLYHPCGEIERLRLIT